MPWQCFAPVRAVVAVSPSPLRRATLGVHQAKKTESRKGPQQGMTQVRMDRVDSTTRSRMMASIRGRDTQPELLVRRALHASGLRFRLHVKDLPGRPDVVLPGRRLAIFVHGCFWHRHSECPYATTPATRRAFWESKFAANVARDQRKAAGCEDAGWRVLTIWECETRQPERLAALVSEIGAVRVVARRSASRSATDRILRDSASR